MFSLLYLDIKTGSEHPVVGNNSVTAGRGSIVQLKDTSFWSLPDNTVYTGHLTESSSSKLAALPTTGTRKSRTGWEKVLLDGSPCSLQGSQTVARFNKAVYLNA